MFQINSVTHRRPLIRTAFLSLLFLQAAYGVDTVKRVVHKAMPSVVQIRILDDKGSIVASGSGYVVNSNGLIATNHHVIENATHAVAVLSDNQSVRVLGVRYDNKERDVAILQVEATALPAIALGNSDGLEAGDDVVAIGAPLELPKTVTAGIVSNIRDVDGTKWIQHTAAISPGSSGGPLLNSRGQVVGMNTLYLPKGQSLYFAVPVNFVKAALDHLPAQLTSLKDLAAEQQTAEQQRPVDEPEKLFYRYDDPDGLFHVVLPKAWQTQRAVTRDEQGNTVVLFVASDASAGQVKLNGPLSAGIRIRIVIPADGNAWSDKAQVTLMQTLIASAESGYNDVKATDPNEIQLSGRRGVEMFLIGASKDASARQLTGLIILPGDDAVTGVEITLPAEGGDLFKAIHEVFVRSFQLGTE